MDAPQARRMDRWDRGMNIPADLPMWMLWFYGTIALILWILKK